MNDNTVKCRVCWETKEIRLGVLITTKWSKESPKTIKDVILLCVPWMSIEDDCYLCKPCLWQLKYTYDFIDRCLKTENILLEANNESKLNLENMLEKSLRKGNKIQIIFENPLSTQTDDINDNAKDKNGDVGTNNKNVHLNESAEKNNSGDMGNMNFQIHTPISALPLEHDYYKKKGSQIYIDVTNNQHNNTNSNTTTENKSCENRPVQDIPDKICKPENENIFTISDDSNDPDNDFSNESNVETASVKNTPCELNILQTILTLKKKLRRSKTVLTKPDLSEAKDPYQVKLEQELKDLLDIAPMDIWVATVHNELSAEQHNDLVREGVNILNMSKDPKKKKRTIYLGRELFKDLNTCNKCNKTFVSRYDYLDHCHFHRRGKIKTPGVPIFTCSDCSETFTLDKDYRTHTKQAHGVCSPHVCSKCNKKFRTIKNLKDHCLLFKNQEKCVYICKRCNKQFYQRSSLIQHEEDVKDAPCCNYKKCKVCFKKFTKEDFKVHCTEVHSNSLCSECGKSFPTSANLLCHQKLVHYSENCVCHECGKILSHPQYLQHHMEIVHGEKKYICDKCPRQFACQAYVRKHMKTHLKDALSGNVNARRKWQCDQCGKACTAKNTLRQHQRMFHLGIKKFVCAICNEAFARNDYLKRHLRNHAKYSTNTCNVCSKSFATDWKLERHLSAGHDENGKSLESDQRSLKKKYTKKVPLKCLCKICGKVMANTATLKLHYKTHLNLRRSKCDICGIVFQSNMALKRHKKLHDDPHFQFSCNICHAYKSSSTELEHHMLNVHKEKKHKCHFCVEAFGRKHLLRSHETLVHNDEIDKRRDLYKILQEDQIFLPPDDGDSDHQDGKFVEIVVDVDPVISKLMNNRKGLLGGSELTTAVVDIMTPSNLPVGRNVVTLDNEYQNIEVATACRLLEEENLKND